MVKGSTVKSLTNWVFGVWYLSQLPITHYPFPSPQSPIPNP
ncbi:hypothetical protein FDUTEX481_09008 [Tolypothrix sp. PCC 7601]|nr:hypothetical protein FDUTEX481_09008 [Tolypothrix sp. PCC 7601]